jgi:pimeloyl-ACP methyl ester carboxylesterase
LPYSFSLAATSTNRRGPATSAQSRARRRAIRVTGALLLILVVAQLPPVRTVLITASLVPQLVDLGFQPLSAVTGAPLVETTSYGAPADRMDVYTPSGLHPGTRVPGVILALGVHPVPIDDPEIANIASAMARAGVVVGVPDSSALRDLRVTPAEPGHLADAVLALADRVDVDGSRVGLVGFSAGASMALDAAADPRLVGHLDFVSSFGGYADAKRLLVDVASRTTQNQDGTVSPWMPNSGMRTDVLGLAIEAMTDDGQRGALHGALDPIVASDASPTFDSGAAQAFGGDAAHIYDLFTAADRPTAQAAMAALSPTLQVQLEGISPTTYADGIHVPVYLLHGVTDTSIPIVHALLLRDVLGDRVKRLTEFGRFGHGQPGVNGLSLDDAGDVFALSLYLRDVVAAATE